MGNNIFKILRNMFVGSYKGNGDPTNIDINNSCSYVEKEQINSKYSYQPELSDLRLVIGGKILTIVYDKGSAGLWTAVPYDFCSMPVEKGCELMENLIINDLEEAYKSLFVRLDDNHYILNIADDTNRSAMNERGPSWKQHCDNMIRIFAPLILRFVSDHSNTNKVGLIVTKAGGTCISADFLCNILCSKGIVVNTVVAQFDFLKTSDTIDVVIGKLQKESEVVHFDTDNLKGMSIGELSTKGIDIMTEFMANKLNHTMFDLDRFLSAQDNLNSYELALSEVRNGLRRTHWIWYVFPQIHGLGYSLKNQKYSIKSLLEAKAYLENNTLRNRLYEISHALLEQDYSASNILGGLLESMKVRSCMTLFDIVSPEDVFADVLDKFYNKTRCELTLKMVEQELDYYNAHSAFERNGIHASEKAFLEVGSEESNKFNENEKIGTLLDLLSRGEKLKDIVSHYLWSKDLSTYRPTGIEYSIRQYFAILVNNICEKSSNEVLVKKVISLEDKLCSNETDALIVSDLIDQFYSENITDFDFLTIERTYVKYSVCKPERTMKRFYNRIERPLFTPSKIASLMDDEVFVFGSNLAGMHAGGAARTATNRFGAIMGQGVGLQGQSYAIPTMQGGVETIKPYADEFILFTKKHKELFFYVTRIGCGIAGFKDEDIAPLFKDALDLYNVCLPKSFVEVLKPIEKPAAFPQISRSASHRLYQQGQVRTLADIAKALNDRYHFTSLDDFSAQFGKTISSYEERGTVSPEVCSVIIDMIRENEIKLFSKDGYLDFDMFITLVDNLSYSDKENPLDVIYSCREKTKILRLAALLNEIAHYTSAEDLLYDLCGQASGRFNCGDNSFMDDTFRYPLIFFMRGIKKLWNDIQKDGYMSSELLEEKMFTEHEQKVARFGLNTVIEHDFVQDSVCHPEVYVPKRIGTAPVYVKDRFYLDHCSGEPKFVKSCGEGKGPNAHETAYESRLVRFVLDRLCKYNVYKKVGGYYIPVKDDVRPIIQKYHGVMRFDVERDKWLLLNKLRHLKEE